MVCVANLADKKMCLCTTSNVAMDACVCAVLDASRGRRLAELWLAAALLGPCRAARRDAWLVRRCAVLCAWRHDKQPGVPGCHTMNMRTVRCGAFGWGLLRCQVPEDPHLC